MVGCLGSQVGKAAHVGCPGGERRQVTLHFPFRDRLGGRGVFLGTGGGVVEVVVLLLLLLPLHMGYGGRGPPGR